MATEDVGGEDVNEDVIGKWLLAFHAICLFFSEGMQMRLVFLLTFTLEYNYKL